MKQLMAAMTALEPPNEVAGSVVLADVYFRCEFYVDIGGPPLGHRVATAARETEIELLESKAVCTKVRREPWTRVIATKLLDRNKVDDQVPN